MSASRRPNGASEVRPLAPAATKIRCMSRQQRSAVRDACSRNIMRVWSGRFRPSDAAANTQYAQHFFDVRRSEEHTSELQSLMRISYAVFCLKKKTKHKKSSTSTHNNNT